MSTGWRANRRNAIPGRKAWEATRTPTTEPSRGRRSVARFGQPPVRRRGPIPNGSSDTRFWRPVGLSQFSPCWANSLGRSSLHGTGGRCPFCRGAALVISRLNVTGSVTQQSVPQEIWVRQIVLKHCLQNSQPVTFQRHKPFQSQNPAPPCLWPELGLAGCFVKVIISHIILVGINVKRRTKGAKFGILLP